MNVKVILLLLGTLLIAAACDSGPDRSAERSATVRAKPVPAKSAAGTSNESVDDEQRLGQFDRNKPAEKAL
jgi:hypothetical protein